MQVSGLVIASDGVQKHGLIDVVDTPIYGGWKFLLKDKILNPALILRDSSLLIEPAIKAMFDAGFVNDVVVVGNQDQQEDLEEVVSKNSNGKPYKVIPNNGNIGEVVATGANNVLLPGYFFIMMPDLPFVTGETIDFAIADILRPGNLGADVYLPVISDDFFEQHNEGWTRPFARLSNNGVKGRFKRLDFTIADSRSVNPEAVKKYYDLRMISSLRGKAVAVRNLPSLTLGLAMKYLTLRLSMADLEGISSELYRGEVRIVQVFDPVYATFMKDIDTARDYRAYQRSNPALEMGFQYSFETARKVRL